MSPKISENSILTIGIPVYNAEKTISKSIDSLLNQSFHNFILIISDNASTDLTEKICMDYTKIDPRIKYIRQENNLGLLKNWNFIVQNANTKYFMWAAADDFWKPDFIKKNIQILENDEGVVGSISKVGFTNQSNSDNLNHETGKSYNLVLNISGTYENRIKKSLQLNQATSVYAIFRTKKLQKSLVFREYGAYDLQIILNILEFGRLNVIDELLMIRLPGGTSSKSYIRTLLKNKIHLHQIIFPYMPVTSFCLRKLGFTFFIKNLFLFFRLNANGSYLIMLDILKILKNS
jgi:glycosyltransferase involved in cell wall biosynthesis